MGERTQEEVTSQPKKKYVFNWGWAVICKGCKRLHEFEEMHQYPSRVSFPQGDFSVVSAYCPVKGQHYEYANEELMHPQDEPLPETKKALRLLAQSIDKTNERVRELESFVGLGKTEEQRKTLQQRLTETEELTTRIADALLLSDGTTAEKQKVKPTPKGQLA